MSDARRTHLYKRTSAWGHARDAEALLIDAIKAADAAEARLKLSGYKGAARGVHVANLRLKAWLEKVGQELA